MNNQMYKEKIDNQLYQTTVIVNEYEVPLIARIFGKKNVFCDQEWDEENIIQIHNIIYRKRIIIQTEIIITRIKIDAQVINDEEYYKEILITVNPNHKDHWTKQYFKTEKKEI